MRGRDFREETFVKPGSGESVREGVVSAFKGGEILQ